MAKDLSKSKKQPMAMQKGAVNMEAKAQSGNLQGDAYSAPMENNMKRRQDKHMGAMPMHNPNGLM